MLYNATDGPDWSNDANRLSGHVLDTWHGVTTDASGRVTGLNPRERAPSSSVEANTSQHQRRVGEAPQMIRSAAVSAVSHQTGSQISVVGLFVGVAQRHQFRVSPLRRSQQKQRILDPVPTGPA